MSKKEKETKIRLLDELRIKAKLARLSPDGTHEYDMLYGPPNDKTLKGVENTESLDSANWFCLVEKLIKWWK